MLRQSQTVLTIDTPGRGLVEITGPVTRWLATTGIADGLLTLFIRHTSASLLVQENADPDVRGDLDRFFARMVVDGDPLFRHRDEGDDDMPAHVRGRVDRRAAVAAARRGQLALGTWQGLYVWEHRLRPHRREVALHLLGD